MMTSREVVQRTLDYDSPERVARSFADSDLVHAGCSVKGSSKGWEELEPGRWESTDLWGNTWARIDETSKGEVARGVLEDVEDIDSYEFPDFSSKDHYRGAAEQRKKNPDKYLLGSIHGFPFSIARKMFRLDNYLMKIMLERDLLRKVHDRIETLLNTMILNLAEAGVDGVMFAEDWGTQSQTLVSPDLWMEEYFPHYERLCRTAHNTGVKVFMHSCGQTEAIVPGLMEAGIDVLQFDQPELHGIDNLARHQDRGRITFWCPVDIQTTLQSGNGTMIGEKAREMLDKLWKGRGGFIAGHYGDNASIGLDPKWQEIASSEFLKHGVRSNF